MPKEPKITALYERLSRDDDLAGGLTLRNSLGTFRHKQDSTLVAEQATIFSTSCFLRVNI